jgi:hypothetical protein
VVEPDLMPDSHPQWSAVDALLVNWSFIISTYSFIDIQDDSKQIPKDKTTSSPLALFLINRNIGIK